MCGIIGYIGKDVEKNLIEGLEKLEYRGYDSAGLCTLRNNDFYVEKSVGDVKKLKDKVKFFSDFGLGIAHTRWATHGKISIENAHPHFSSKGEVAIVHNGIIENFENLKGELEKDGAYFYGETDSEVVAKYLKGKLNLKKIRDVKNKLKGTYALAIISKRDNSIFFAKYKSPLYVAIGQDCAMIASDPSCFVGKCENFYPVNDGEYGKLELNKIQFFDCEGKQVIKKSQKLNIDYHWENKKEYEHFMLKEINESESVLHNILEKYTSCMQEMLKDIKKLDFDRIYLVGCGTAYHAALVGQRYLRSKLKKDVYCDRASEFQYNSHIINEKSLCIFISQSGETIDTISALEYAKSMGGKIISITNVSYSTIATKAEYNFPIFAGPEIGVASTKAYVGQCIVLYIISQYLSHNDFLAPLQQLKLDYGDDDKIKEFARVISKKDRLFFIGRGFDYITALEASLKMKEITYINSVVEPSGELKHGPIALIENGTIIIAVATDEKLNAKTINNAYETKSRGAFLAIVTNTDLDRKTKDNFDYVFKIKDADKDLMPIQSILFFQKLAYFVALERHTNPDKPRNLAKSVTVE